MDRAAETTALVRKPGTEARVLDPTRLDEIDTLRDGAGSLVWLDVADPGEAEIGLLRREFDLHPLAEEDIQLRNQRPKVDTYPGQHVLIAYEVRTRSAADGRPAGGPPIRTADGLAELHLFVGSGYLVSVHWGPSPAIIDVQRRFRRSADPVGSSVGALLYAVLDAVVDGYFPLLDDTAERIDALEDRIVEGGQVRGTLREVLDLKRELLELRRILAPMRDVANSLLRRDVAEVDAEVMPYFQDLYDHLVRVLDQLDLYRDLVAAALDANLSVTSNNLNAVMKRLTAFTVVLMVPTLIAGIYGMNFRVMPELTWPFGYFAALGVMGLAMTALALFFWRRDWF
jgi:magnesium transporter